MKGPAGFLTFTRQPAGRGKKTEKPSHILFFIKVKSSKKVKK
jgi:hypothetical protein